MPASVLAELRFEGCLFQVVQGNLLDEPVDAIVNAANGMLAHGGGVAGIISRAAGPALQEESDRIVHERGPFPTGSAVVTAAGNLPFKGVIHAVGPRYGEGDEERKLVARAGVGLRVRARAGLALGSVSRRYRAGSFRCRSTSARGRI
jgi:O-acetyl-ADP-ribose deacetylase (regulator of RNase III)